MPRMKRVFGLETEYGITVDGMDDLDVVRESIEIVRCYTTVSRKGGRLKLLNLTKKIQDLLSITKLLTVFETYEAEGEAVNSFK